MRIVQLPVDVVIERSETLLVLFPRLIPLVHHIKQLRIVLAVPVEPDAEFSVDLIHVHSVGVFEIEQGVHEAYVGSVIHGRNGMWIDTQNLGDLPDQILLGLSGS